MAQRHHHHLAFERLEHVLHGTCSKAIYAMQTSLPRSIVRAVFALFFIVTGISHFVDPQPFLAIMPPSLPAHLALVYLSGFFEICGGVGLLIKQTRTLAAWGLLALLAAVFPANIHMAINEVYLEGMPRQAWLLWARLPLQFVGAYGVLWSAGLIRNAKP